MSKFNKIAFELFPKLCANALRLHALTIWADQYPEGIKRIVLYKYSSKKKKYAVVFEVISDICQSYEKYIIEHMPPLITEDLSKVYREKPKHNFKNDWVFFVKLLYKESHCLIVDPLEWGTWPYSQRKILYLVRRVSKQAGLRVRNPHDLRQPVRAPCACPVKARYTYIGSWESFVAITMDVFVSGFPGRGERGRKGPFWGEICTKIA